jgi:tetratricopeptide (TPR) repeat protein
VSFSRTALLAVLMALAGASCRRGPERTTENVAILPFEDLSSNSAIPLLGSAAARFASSLTEGDRTNRVTFENSLRDAQLHRATRTVSGWLEVRNGEASLHGTVRDETSGKAVRSFLATAPSGDLGKLAGAIAAETGAPVRKFPAPNTEAALAFEQSVTSPDLPAATSALDRALTLDPGYGAAAVRRVYLAQQSRDTEGLTRAVIAAKQARLTEADRARLDLVTAADAAARASALKRLAAIEASNPDVLTTLMTAQFDAQDFRGAAETANQALEIAPGDEDVLNRRGYAYAFAGDLPAARRAFEEYRKRLPQSANAVDSLAEVLFYFRRYDEAAGLFLDAHRRNPAIVNGGEPFRAALAYALAGNLPEADKQIAGWFKARANDPLLPLRQAIWSRMTGRQSAMPRSAAGLATDALYTLRDGDRARAAQLAAEARALVKSPPEAALALTAVVLTQPSAPPDVWRSRAAAVTPDPRMHNVRNELTSWSLLLDRHYAEAVDVLRPTFETGSALTSNDVRMVLFWALAEAGRKDEAHKVMPEGWLPPVSIEPGLAVLLYPKVPELRAKS